MEVKLLLYLALVWVADGETNCKSDCNEALGMEDARIKDSEIFGGTVYNADYETFGPQNARLNNRLGYRADPLSLASSNIVGISLGKRRVITAIATQGFGDPSFDEWVTRYSVMYEDSGGVRAIIMETDGNSKIFEGNTDSNSVKLNALPIPVYTSSVFLMPLMSHNNVGLRIELYGCEGGHYFVAWLMSNQTYFTLSYADYLSHEYEEVVQSVIDEVNNALGTTWGFLFARIRELSPQRSPGYLTMVTAIVEIYCLRSSEHALLAKLKSVLETGETSLEPNYIKFQHPERCGCPPVIAHINLKKNIKNATEVRISQRFFRSPVVLTHSCESPEMIFYSWKISKVNPRTGLYGPLQDYGKKKVISLPLWMIGQGYCYIQCIVEVTGNGGAMAYDYGYINIVLPPLIAKITNLGMDSESRLKLSAQGSHEGGSKSKGTRGMELSWFCRQESEILRSNLTVVTDAALGRKRGNKGCFGFGPGILSSFGEVLELNTSKMVTGKKLFIKLIVTKGERHATAELEYTLKPRYSVNIRCLSNCGKKVIPQKGLLLEAFLTGDLRPNVTQYTWSLYVVNEGGEKASTSAVGSTKLLPQLGTKRLLVENLFNLERDTNRYIRYVVKAEANLDRKTTASGEFTFVVNSPPTKLSSNASCHVTPEEGDAYTTDFLMSCWGWHDEDQPLTFQFLYRKEYGMVVLQTGYMAKVNMKLPAGDTSAGHALALQVLVGDSYENFVTVPLFVKVRPLKAHKVDQKFVEDTLSFIRDFVNVGDADRATELAFTLMSTVKSTTIGGSRNYANTILQDMKGLKIKSVAHVTKVAAVIIMTTEMEEKISPSSQESAVLLLRGAINFMSSQLTSNSTHDANLARNVSSVLLSGIGNVLRVSSEDASVQTKDELKQKRGRKIAKETLELAMRFGEALSKATQSSAERTAVTSNFVDIVIYKKTTKSLGGQRITEGNTGVVLPDSRELYPNSNETVTIQLMAFSENPYTWDNTATNIRSSVIDVTLRTSTGAVIRVANLSKPLALHIPTIQTWKRSQAKHRPKQHLFIKPGAVRHHSVFIPSKEHEVSLRIASADRMIVYIGYGFRPNPENYTSTITLPNFSSCQKSRLPEAFVNCTSDPYMFHLFGLEPGYYSIAVSLVKGANSTQVTKESRIRRSCRSFGGRQKRSCVEVKDPPTTPPPTPLVVIPKYNGNTDVNYTFYVTIGTCLYWSEKEEKWTSEGCKIGPNSQTDSVHCLCSHLSSFGGDFFVAPNTIDFDKVWTEFGRLGKTGNYVVLSTVCTMLGAYLIGLILARRADTRDELKVIADFQLSDQRKGKYTYCISVETGAWRKCGSTANVGLILYGDEGVSEPIILAHQHLKEIFFARGSVNNFTLNLAKPLGSLFKIKVWHDNSGKSPSWFLRSITVEDAQTYEKWHFIAHRWLAVEKGDGKIEVELAVAGESDRFQFKNVFHSRTQRAVGDSHLWVSLFTKAPHNRFTRCQRLSCCLSIVFCAMVTNAMFYRFGIKAADTFHLGPLKMNWLEIKIGIQSGLVAIPVNLLVAAIFKNTKQSGDKEPCSGCLPHFFVYIGWFLCISAMLSSAVFTVFYSLSWGAEISNQWLVSMTVSFLQDVCLIQPMKLFLVVCLLSVIIRKPLDPEEVRGSQLGPEQVNAHAVDEKTARILELEELKNLRRRRRREIKAFRAIVEIQFFLLFVVLLMVVCYGNRNSVRYTLTRSMKNVFKDFEKVNSTPDFWSWVRNILIPGLYNVRWYNGDPFDYHEGFITNRETFLIGMPRLKQVRVRPVHCGVQTLLSQLAPPRCLPYYAESYEDTTPYSKPGWVPVFNVSLFRQEADLDSICPKPWQYQTAHALHAEPTQGHMGTYRGSGYVAKLGYNAYSAIKVMESLEKNHWINDKTAAVVVECTVFEPSSSLFSVMKYLYERCPTGGVITSSMIETVTVYLTQGSKGYRRFYQLCQVLLMIVIVGLTLGAIARASRGTRVYFLRFWGWVNILLIFFAASGIVIMFVKEEYARKYVENVRVNPFDNWSTDQLLRWSELEDYLLSFVTFLITIKFLRFIRFNRHISNMWITLKVSSAPVVSFGVVFVVLLLAFATFGVFAFGSSLRSYSSILQSVRSLLQMVIGGKMAFYQLKWTNAGVLGPVFLFAYLLITLAVIVNTFLAILNESYKISREEDKGMLSELDDIELAKFVWSRARTAIAAFRRFLRSSFHKSTKHKYEVNGNCSSSDGTELYIPKLASMDSLHGIDEERRPLNMADNLMSELQAQLCKIFPEAPLFKENTFRDDKCGRSVSYLSTISSLSEDMHDDQSSSSDDELFKCPGPESPLLDFELDSSSRDEVRDSCL